MESRANGTAGGIGSWATRRAILSGDRIAMIDGDRRITYTEFDRRTNQLARALRELGVRQGDRVAVLLVNSAAFLETMFATAKLGAVFVPINFRLPRPRSPTCWPIPAPTSSSGRITCPRWPAPPLTARAYGCAPSGCWRRARRRRDRLRRDARERRAGRSASTWPEATCPASCTRRARPAGPRGRCSPTPSHLWNARNALLLARGSARPTSPSRPRRCSTSAGSGCTRLPFSTSAAKNVIVPTFDPPASSPRWPRPGDAAVPRAGDVGGADAACPDFDDHDLSSLDMALSGGAPTPLPLIEFFKSGACRSRRASA